ncbi:hypothetical protein [Nonomuraea angiospora]|uniref:hypothetical protein n=1 Tax=Nonomuraea angiospora TaxID=46172 RepID=UPI0029A22305|nr:hypothetical protein [Nonomuraea angiospora]MDX3106769.1 hypothetical protein [Nonomuraea angiospora]
MAVAGRAQLAGAWKTAKRRYPTPTSARVRSRAPPWLSIVTVPNGRSRWRDSSTGVSGL